jgi:hypothetical protein
MAVPLEPLPLDVSKSPELLALARDVKRSGTPLVLCADGEELARISPARRARRTLKGRPTSAEDPFWRIIGMGRSGEPSDASERVDDVLAEFELASQA